MFAQHPHHKQGEDHKSRSNISVLPEKYIQDCFHVYLKNSLRHAKVERLLDDDVLASAEGDLMITAPALCLYFTALNCTTTPPSVPLPRSSKSKPPRLLSYENCPPSFAGFLRVWANAVARIQGLTLQDQEELAREICGLQPPQYDASAVNELAAELCAVAIEISQRRSFQERFASDLQAALNVKGGEKAGHGAPTSPNPLRASFVPPPTYAGSITPFKPHRTPSLPGYTPSPTTTVPSGDAASTPARSPLKASQSLRHSRATRDLKVSIHDIRLPPQTAGLLSPLDSANTPTSPYSYSHSHSRSTSQSQSHNTHHSRSAQSGHRRPRGRSPSPAPSILNDDAPAIEFIRETLYASLGDALERQPSLRRLLRSGNTDKARAYFASVAFAVLEVARTAIAPDGAVEGVLGQRLTLAECPRDLRPLMAELDAIGARAQEMEEEDTRRAMKMAQRGVREMPIAQLDRVKMILEEGIGYTEGLRDIKRDPNCNYAQAISLANRINALSLRMTELKAFREKQEVVFEVLAGVGASFR
ncbi:hypothetical protein D9619_012560 [Psilocybe cf. subviscida]|uniref:Uncharacterized protein n=1 Tax=Psilocybe cf. subviscida TaxID=2480587 RepID=A0A8H5EZI0_9AGAR|nr:hypothetical protein D9619_012560 [Psilocybe cf. subviscida]